MARRRRSNHGVSTLAGTLALKAVTSIVPRDRLQLTRLQVAWIDVARGNLRRVSWPGRLNDGQLTLFVRDNQWLHELTYMTAELLARLCDACPDAGLRKIRLSVGPIPEVPPPPPPPPPPDIVELSDEPPRETISALHDIEDMDLRQAMANARLALSSGKLRT